MKRFTKSEFCLLIACFAAYTAAYISRCNLSPSLNDIAADFGITTAAVGLLPTLFALPYAAGQIFSGMLADRVPAHRLMLSGLLGSALLNVLFSFSHHFSILLIIWFVNGLVQSLIWTPIVRILAVSFRDEVRGSAVFIISLTLIFGYLIAWALSGILTSLLSWRTAFMASGIVTALIALPSISLIVRQNGSTQTTAQHSEDRETDQAPLGRLILHTNLLLILLGCFCNGYVRDGISNWAPKLLMDTQGIDLGSAVTIILIIPGINFLGILLGRKVYRKLNKNVYLSSGLLFLFSTVLCLVLTAASASGLVLYASVLALLSAMAYGLNPLLTSLMPMAFRSLNRVATAAGLIDAMIYVGSAFSGSFAGFLSDRFGWPAVFISWAVLSLIGILSMAGANRIARPDR